MKQRLDLLVKHGRIVDGSGAPWFIGDVGIRSGKIVEMGRIQSTDAKQTIDAEDRIVCPGIVDLHNHSDLSVFSTPGCQSNIMQGITTAVVGNCGLSMAPTSPDTIDLLKEYLFSSPSRKLDYGWSWQSLKDYSERVEQTGISMNFAPIVGHGTLRIAVAGFKSDPLSDSEMAQMKRLLAQSLEQGAFGMSSGLIYPPGCYCETEELIEMGHVLRRYGKIYTSHIRDEGAGLAQSVEETIRIGREAGIPVHVSHLKAKGMENWGKVRDALSRMAEARAEGIDITTEVYPYTAGSTTITSILPFWVLEGGMEEMVQRLKDPIARQRIIDGYVTGNAKGGADIHEAGLDGIVIAFCPSDESYEGKSLHTILKEKSGLNDPYQGVLDFLLEIQGKATVNKFFIDEADVRYALQHELTAVITDSYAFSPESGGKPHPRSYGTFPRVLGKYVREEKLMSLEMAIRKMTTFPAVRAGIFDRGILREGAWADLLIFDPETVRDQATFQNPHSYPVGIEHVLVNGVFVVENGGLTGAAPGCVLSAP